MLDPSLASLHPPSLFEQITKMEVVHFTMEAEESDHMLPYKSKYSYEKKHENDFGGIHTTMREQK